MVDGGFRCAAKSVFIQAAISERISSNFDTGRDCFAVACNCYKIIRKINQVLNFKKMKRTALSSNLSSFLPCATKTFLSFFATSSSSLSRRLSSSRKRNSRLEMESVQELAFGMDLTTSIVLSSRFCNSTDDETFSSLMNCDQSSLVLPAKKLTYTSRNVLPNKGPGIPWLKQWASLQ